MAKVVAALILPTPVKASFSSKWTVVVDIVLGDDRQAEK